MKTKSEGVFESFLTLNNLAFKKIKEDTSSRPDYLVRIGNCEVIFEVKELAGDEKCGVVGVVASATLGEHVRRTIHGSRKQIQFGADQGIPSILLVYNSMDSYQMFGTADLDFTSAMYGEYTVLIGQDTTSELFNGRNQSLQENKNTSFSAVGRLADRFGRPTVTLFENPFSKVKVPYDQLPPCFQIDRAVVSITTT